MRKPLHLSQHQARWNLLYHEPVPLSFVQRNVFWEGNGKHSCNFQKLNSKG